MDAGLIVTSPVEMQKADVTLTQNGRMATEMVASEASWSGPQQGRLQGKLLKMGIFQFIIQVPQDRRTVKTRNWERGREFSTQWMKRWFSHEFEFGGFVILEDPDVLRCPFLNFQWAFPHFFPNYMLNLKALSLLSPGPQLPWQGKNG